LVTCLVPMVVTALVVSYHATTAPPWRDEFATWSAATRTLPEMLELGRNIDGVNLPYYLFMHVWIAWFGDSVLSLRLPSVVAMTATAGVVALLARRTFSNRAGLFAGLLFAAVPAVSRYAEEARVYAFAVFFSALSTLVLMLALDRPRWWRWLAYSVSVLLLGGAHLIALLVLPAHAAAVIAACRRTGRQRAWWWLASAAVAIGALLPLALIGTSERGTQLSWLSKAGPSQLVEIIGAIFLSGLVGGAVAGLAALALRRDGVYPTRGTGWVPALWLGVLFPIGLLFAVDQFVTPVFLARYLLIVVTLLCVLAGRPLAELRVPVALAVIVLIGAMGLPAQLSFRRTHSRYDYRAAAALVRAKAQPGDAIIYAPRGGWQFTDIALRYYLRQDAPRDVLLKSDEVQNGSFWATESPDPAASLTGATRVWALSADKLMPQERVALRSYRELGRWRVSGFTLVLFERR
jgi:mannosyltransferase